MLGNLNPPMLETLGLPFVDARKASLRAEYNTYLKAGNLETAEATVRKLLELDPSGSEVQYNLAFVLYHRRRYDEAIHWVNRAIVSTARTRDARLSVKAKVLKGCLLLTIGDMDEGLEYLEYRLFEHNITLANRRLFSPPDRGRYAELKNKTLLIVNEGGLGDAVMFGRYVPRVKAHTGAASVHLLIPPERYSLFREMPVDRILTSTSELHLFDEFLPFLSLPRLFGTTMDTIPAQIPYLRPPPGNLIAQARSMIDSQAFALSFMMGGRVKKKIGIAWRGASDLTSGVPHGAYVERSMHVQYFRILQDIEGTLLFSLQRRDVPQTDTDRAYSQNFGTPEQSGVCAVDLETGPRSIEWSMAAITNLDLIVTIDTGLAHLAGALCKRVWVLLPYSADWRWLSERTDSPWYPTMRLYRQSKPGDWAEVMQRVAADLRAEMEKATGTPSDGL